MNSNQGVGMHDTIGIHLPILGMAFLLLTACTHAAVPSSLPAVTSPDLSSPVVLDVRAMVVGRHPAAVAQASDDLQQLGFTLVQRDRLQQILDEQDPHLNSPRAAQAYFVRNGFLSGAEVLVLVEVDGPKDAPSVIVKGIDVETGNILWTGGIVSSSGLMEEDYNRVVIDLTHRAVMDSFMKPQGGSTAVLFSHP
jgi:hypothetical protein